MSKKITYFLFLLVFTLTGFQLSADAVNINTADAQELALSLKGVGLKKAVAIVEYREAFGDFDSAMELTEVKGIGEKTVLKNQENIRLNDSESNNESEDTPK